MFDFIRRSQSFLRIFITASILIGVFAPEYFQADSQQQSTIKSQSRITVEQGAIVRGDVGKKRLALVFTGDEFADGGAAISSALKRHNLKASFFFTGRFYRNAEFEALIRGLKSDGHYLGPHSDAHLLYCDWNNRNRLLVSREEFASDLKRNYQAMAGFGISKEQARFFLPPFEWYNQTISDWTTELDLKLINFTPGSRSHADYTTPQEKNYVDSETILKSIKSYEASSANGLNGFILLLHIGADPARTDKFYYRLDELLEFLKSRKYQMVRIDQLL